MSRDYVSERAIDPAFLEEEVLRLPSLYGYYSEVKLELIEGLEEITSQFDLWKAELVLNINNNPEDYGAKKATVAIVDGLVLKILNEKENTDGKKGQLLKKKINTMQHQLDIINIQLRSLEKKDKALEQAIKLHVANWFIGPKEPKNIPPGKRIVDKRSGETAQKIREAGKQRSRRRKT